MNKQEINSPPPFTPPPRTKQKNADNCHAHKPYLASSDSSFPCRTQQQLRNIIGILPIITSFCIKTQNIQSPIL